MNLSKKYISFSLALVLALSAFSACGKKDVPAATEAAPAEIQTESSGYYQIGDKMEDFTITTFDGKEISLYKVLEEKQMVLLNLWATWCGPCGSEFPAMQEAYAQYQDKVEIIALSVEPTDTDEVLAEYVREKGMTFCVARDTADMNSRIYSSGIPTSVVIDRFGTICLIEEGAVPDPEIFARLFETYIAEDYTKSVFLPSMRSEKPDVQPADPAELNEALNGEGGTLVFANSSDEFHWPMTVENKDGRTVAAASNSNSDHSKAVVETRVNVKAGDVLVVEYKLENDIYTNSVGVEVDGKSVWKSAMNQDWCTYAYRFSEDGNHQVSICLDIKWLVDGYSSNLWIDSIRVVSGEEAERALSDNRQYPAGEQIQTQLMNENVTLGFVYDESAPEIKELVYFCSDPTLRLLITLDESVAPEVTFLEDGAYNVHSVADCAADDGFVVEIPNTSADDMLCITTLYCDGVAYPGISIFYDEEYADRYFDMIREDYGVSLKWDYCDESVDIPEVSGDVTYTVTYLDQNGDPVAGVMCQVCDESMCQVFTSDADGICRFTLPAKAYEIHTLTVPEGYEGDTTTITDAPIQGGELLFTLTKK